jgi:hypothetical protein
MGLRSGRDTPGALGGAASVLFGDQGGCFWRGVLNNHLLSCACIVPLGVCYISPKTGIIMLTAHYIVTTSHSLQILEMADLFFLI